MKLSELSTDRAADVLCEISVFLLNITSDEGVIASLKLNTKEAKTVAEKYAMAANRVSQWVPMLLKTHREDVFGILAVLNEKNVGAVADNIVIFFRAKAGSRNSFISTTPIYLCRIKRKAL